MQVINLANEWRVTVRKNTDMDVQHIDVSDWDTTTLPLDENFISDLSPSTRLWLWRTFAMPINEECSTWWLETDVALQGQVWLNGNTVDNPDEDEIFQLEVTNYTALDENVVVLCLEITANLKDWREAACVPYPCA